MPFARPSLADLIARAAADIKSQLVGTDALLRRSVLTIIGRMHAGAMHGLYGFIAWVLKQLMPDSAERDWLDRHANIWGVPRLGAAFAQGQVGLTGNDGATVPLHTVLQRSDGVQFRTQAAVTIAAGVASVTVRAMDAGEAGNTLAPSLLTFVTPVAGVASTATVGVDGLSQGADVEGDDSLRARLLKRIQEPPMGGAKADYEQWAREVAGVTRAWCYPIEGGPGTVVVRFMRDNDATPFPNVGEVAAVQAYIDDRRPVTANVTVAAPIAAPLDPHITLTPDTTATRAAVVAELNDLLLREATPNGTLPLTHIENAIAQAAGVTDYTLVSPTTNVTTTGGHITTLGTPTW